MNEALITGCGDVGSRLAMRLRAAGCAVTGVVRSAASAAALARLGIDARIADLDAEAPGAGLPATAATVLFHFAPPPEAGGDDDPRLRRLLDTLPATPAKLVYLSTSAVYGDCGGAWIDEDAPLAPASARGRRRLAAERLTADWARARRIPHAILRVPGIYGPGRLPRERLLAGTPVARRDEAPYSNRIHAEDLAEAAQLVALRGADGAAYNVSDGQPTTMSDYFIAVARLLGLPPPAEVSLADLRAQASPMLRSFLDESKRLRNDRLRALGWTPRHSSLNEGLPRCLDHDPVVSAFAGSA